MNGESIQKWQRHHWEPSQRLGETLLAHMCTEVNTGMTTCTPVHIHACTWAHMHS